MLIKKLLRDAILIQAPFCNWNSRGGPQTLRNLLPLLFVPVLEQHQVRVPIHACDSPKKYYTWLHQEEKNKHNEEDA